LAASRAAEALETVIRRWRENRLNDDQLKPLGDAARLLADAKPALESAQTRGEDPARKAEASLGQAERILASLLSDSDLTRLLATIIERQRALNQESSAFVVEFLTKALDGPAKSRQGTLVARQQELAGQEKEIERKILAGSAQLAEAQELIRRSAPAENLGLAAQALGSDRDRTAAIDRQTAALHVMVKILELLRGSDAAADLAQRAGELAKRQETIAKRLDMNAPPASLAEDQKSLQQDTARFADQLAKQPQPAKSVRAASDAQRKAEEAMRKGDRDSAAREADTAASLLRDAQRRLSGQEDDPKKNDVKKKDEKSDLIAVLRRLHGQQAQVVADATILHQTIGEKPLDFPAQRNVLDIATREGAVQSSLKEEVLAKLAGHPIAVLAVQRVAVVLDRAATHLNRPALGNRGLRMTKVALAELSRLVAIVEQQPPSAPSNNDGSQGQGQGQGGNNQAPFPPQAELSLLAAMQDEIARLTVTGAPRDVAAGQHDVVTLIHLLVKSSRPGSRPAVLLNRAERSALSAAETLAKQDRGLNVRHQQELAAATLRQLFAEAAAQNSGGSSDDQQQQQKQRDGNPSSSDSQANANSPSGNPAGNASQSGSQPGRPGDTGKGVLSQRDGISIELPPESRERLRQAREQPMPPGALPVFERYLELLEGLGR
jgi:hypothetical protein